MEYLQYRILLRLLPSLVSVLNLVISGIPSIHNTIAIYNRKNNQGVLNLVISGIPSIPEVYYVKQKITSRKF